jgi:hypothetical protein
MKWTFRVPQRSLHWSLFRKRIACMISVNGLESYMLARRYPRGTAGRAVSVRRLYLFLALWVSTFACQGCHSQKSTDSPSLELTKIPPAAQRGERESIRSRGASETLDQSSRLLFMRTAGHGGCSPGRLTSDRDGDRRCRAST